MPDADARGFREVHRVFRDDERRDPVVSGLRLRVRPRRHDEDLTDAGVRDEDLRAAQEVVVTPVFRDRLGTPGVGAGLRLGQPKAAEYSSLRQQRHVAALLLGRAELHDG